MNDVRFVVGWSVCSVFVRLIDSLFCCLLFVVGGVVVAVVAVSLFSLLLSWGVVFVLFGAFVGVVAAAAPEAAS